MDALTIDLSLHDNSTNKVNFFLPRKKILYLSWVEKYRPRKINHIILDDITKTRINNFISKKEISNIIITGPPGTGKTSTIICLAREIYKQDYKNAVIELNASDNRGLDSINNNIIHFCKRKVDTQDNLPKLVILDEADNITKKAQNTLINLIEKYENTTKFAFTCNDYNKLIEGIQSRCIILRYNTIQQISMFNRLKSICNKENIKYNVEGLETIIFISQGDIRYAINCLESCAYGFKSITTNNVYKICEKPPRVQIEEIINLCQNKQLRDAIDKIMKIKNDGYCNNDILLTIINVLKIIDIDEDYRMSMLEIASNANMVINSGIDTDLQLLKCICLFINLCI